ncbi:glycosyl hydrolase family 65 protein [uncultured Croceitalea sp.]|uniref:GH36-type glycosyl hydrolase domain-containing protein n=1 Tax=uncultured Croceitalea sp. TaxID=1798908 RepID=UPI0033065D01
MIKATDNGVRLELDSPTKLPNASSFLWNKRMMVHMNCRGYAVAQFMQPEPAKYAHSPNLEAKTFMQPEQPYYDHHPGRFFYIKDEEAQAIFSVPYAPVKAEPDSFVFSAGKSDILWKITHQGLYIELRLELTENDVLEKWSFSVKNVSGRQRKLSIYPYFPVGYMSWMNQSGAYHEDICGIICSSITPYQKYKDYEKIKTLKDKTFFLADKTPYSWEVNQAAFEGEGGLRHPYGIAKPKLDKGNALYETPAAILQYKLSLAPNGVEQYRFLFGPALDKLEVREIRTRYFDTREKGFEASTSAYENYMAKGVGSLRIKTPDTILDNFVNNWLPRQIYYHGETNRLSTDPQTRNYLQDNMGMGYIDPKVARATYVTALSQQEESGAMPDGILIHPEAQLKYINQVPHTDHCVWLPICLKAYLDETNDYELLEEMVPFAQGTQTASIAKHLNLAMDWLYAHRDERGLNYIDQGDWCDPMNMVGPQGKGVSGWLSLATAYALKVWSGICEKNDRPDLAESYRKKADEVNKAVNTHLWDGQWYARGITDANVVFGIQKDNEGRIFLNPQAWALLSGCADNLQSEQLIKAVEAQLETPFGVELMAPAFTKMREDIGRVTQKFPGSAENGSVYNHAVAFYMFGLFETGYTEKAFEILRRMLPGPDEDDVLQRGQIPVFIPNYYRGAYRQFPRTAGRSSQLFNTGTVSWFYRSLIDGLFGLRGDTDGLHIAPQLPKAWSQVEVTRTFRGSTLHITMERSPSLKETQVLIDGKMLENGVLQTIPEQNYTVKVLLPV